MADRSAIEWTDATWNPIVGCSILSPGCINCYAMDEAARQIRCAKGLGRETHYAGTVETVKGNVVWTGKLAMAPDHILLAPLKRKKPTKYFVNSMGDLFHEDCPDEWIDKVFAVMALAPQHTFQVLTKRAARMREYLSDDDVVERIAIEAHKLWAAKLAPASTGNLSIEVVRDDDELKHVTETLRHWPLPNAWLGVSTERQQEADERIPLLLETPAAIRFISAEPLLGPINLTEFLRDGHPTQEQVDGPRGMYYLRHGSPRLDWVIAGGESGRDARPMHPGWARSLRDQCAAASVPFLFKQWGQWHPRREEAARAGIAEHCLAINGTISRGDELSGGGDRPRWIAMVKVGKKAAGRLLDGIEHNEFPTARAL